MRKLRPERLTNLPEAKLLAITLLRPLDSHFIKDYTLPHDPYNFTSCHSDSDSTLAFGFQSTSEDDKLVPTLGSLPLFTMLFSIC